MTVPLLRVCYHCGYPTPGRHASSCRDADSGVVEVAKPLVPAQVAQQIRDVEAQRDGLAELLKGAVEAGERLRQELDEAQAEIARLQEHEQTRAQVIADHQGRLIAARDIAAERDRMRPVVEAAEAWRPLHGSEHEPCRPERCGQLTCALTRAIDGYRSAAPGAEPAPGVPADTEATP